MKTVKNKTAIYKITNEQTNKVYVGSTKHFAMRKATHIFQMKNGIHRNRELVADYKLGHTFQFQIIERVEEVNLGIAEKIWTAILKPEYNFYNTDKKRKSRAK